MQLKLKHTMLFLSLCAAFSACNERNALDNPTGKTPIELSVGGVDSPEPALTRAVITDGTGKTLNAFDVDTKIFMVMKSEYDTGNADFDDPDAPHVAKYTVARGDVLVSENDIANNRSIVKFDATNQRYWDDAHARSSQLDIWAYAQKGMNWKTCAFEVPNAGGVGLDAYKDKPYDTSTAPSPVWSKGAIGEIYPAIRRWRASHHYNDGGINFRQTQTSVMCQDLLFSNNLTNNSSGDNRLTYDFSTRKFPQVGEAHMIFYHAMSKITIHIKKGEGFKNTDPFAFSTGNIKLMGFNTEGLFNIKTGQFEYIHEHYDIPEIYKWATPAAGDTYTLEALVIPNVDGNVPSLVNENSRWVDGSTTKSMEFIIDHNKYEISQDQLYDALNANPANASIVASGKVDLEAGKNYVFTFTVGKQKINNITAQVAPWENVEAENINATNARIKLQLEERGTAQTSDVAFYKANDNKTTDGIDDNHATYNWKTGYANMNATYSTDHWTTDLFWQSNKDFYHFRALMPDETTVTTDGSGDGDYVTLTSAASYTDVRWGAPMKDDGDNETAGSFKWTYDPETNGFDNSGHTQIYKAIGPTEDPIKLILFHMMSDLTIKIKTTTGADKVTLVDETDPENKVYTKVQLEGFYAGGKVLLGTGLVKTTGSATAKDRTAPAIDWNSVDGDYQVYKYGVVPQGLTGVQLRITTPDKNEYIVDLGNLKVSTEPTTTNIANPYTETSSGSGKYIIDRWYPGFKYTYTFTLKKKGIVDLQATIVDWENITAGDDNVQIQ